MIVRQRGWRRNATIARMLPGVLILGCVVTAISQAQQNEPAAGMSGAVVVSKPPGSAISAAMPSDPPVSPENAPADQSLPDEPVAAAAAKNSSPARPIFSLEPAMNSAVRPAFSGTYVSLQDCPYDETHARECRVHWLPMLLESSLYNAFENAGNVYTGYWYRWETTHGKWWDRYIDSAAGWRWDRWADNNPPLDDYVGHPFMGSTTNSIWIQNDPKAMTVEFGNNWVYWRSRLRALPWTTFYSFQWKLGPFGEAAIGHNGDHYFTDKGVVTNETGWVELVTTPLGGFAWTIGEDYLDKHVVRSLEQKSRNPILLTTYQFLTPTRGFANILRFRPPWYRDSRIVKASGFWTDPGEGVSASTEEAMRYAEKHGVSLSDLGVAAIQPAVPSPPDWQGPGGRHEFGAWWGMSLISGNLWGSAADVKYMPIDLRYSYEFYRHRQSWTMRYSPDITALAMLDWPTPAPPPLGSIFNQRTRAYGSGLSPVGFQWDFLPLRRVQPFLSGDGGFIYFDKRVLSPQGSQWMYTVDFGGGFNFFHHRNQAITIGYRYQHLSNANISVHNPGTDANTFYVGVSRFRNKGDRSADNAR
jgi:Lipid A 3-O-deacylase (PagL)